MALGFRSSKRRRGTGKTRHAKRMRKGPKPSRRSVRSSSGRTPSARGSLYSSRKLSKKAWRNSLRAQTRHLPHYRSVNAFVKTIQTPVSTTQWTIASRAALDDFWLVGAGLQPLDVGDTTDPAFQGDLVIRGGIVGCQLENKDDSAMYVQVYLVKMNRGVTPAELTDSDVTWGYDINNIVDFNTTIGRVVTFQSKTLLPQDSLRIVRHLPIQKIDQGAHQLNDTYRWFFILGNTASEAVTMIPLMWYNLSFTGDATVITTAA